MSAIKSPTDSIIVRGGAKMGSERKAFIRINDASAPKSSDRYRYKKSRFLLEHDYFSPFLLENGKSQEPIT